MVKIGETLLNPEEGWIRYDDLNEKIEYNGLWQISSENNGDWGSSQHFTDYGESLSNGSFYKFRFKGTKFRIISVLSPNSSNDIEIYLNNRLIKKYSSYSATVTRRILVHEEINLPKQIHTVKVINKSTKYLVLDAIDLGKEDVLLNPRPYNKLLFLNNGEYKTYIAKYKDITPVMTRNGEPYTVTANQWYDKDEPWKVFDDNISDPRPFWFRSWIQPLPNIGYWYLTIDLKERKNIGIIGMDTIENTGSIVDSYGIKNWEIYGSNDNENFEFIYKDAHSRNGEMQFYNIKNNGYFRYYKICVLDSYSRGAISIKSIKIFEIDKENSYWETISKVPPTKQQFIDYGMENVPNVDVLKQLSGTVELLYWTDEESETRRINFSGIPKGRVVSFSNKINLNGELRGISSSENLPSEGVRYLLSYDNSNWKSYKNNTWIIVDHNNNDDIIANGMTLNELNSLTGSELSSFKNLNIGVFIDEDVDATQEAKISKINFTENLKDQTAKIDQAKLYILNTSATINIQFQGNTVLGEINDVDKGKVQYRVLLNGDPYFPENGSFTPLEPSPLEFGITIDSKKINLGHENFLKVEFQDYWGHVDHWEVTFVGTYAGLIFKDKNGEEFSTDLGDILKKLDFGILVAGQTTLEHEIKLKNTYGFPVKNVHLSTDKEQFPDKVKLEFGTNLISFEGKDDLLFTDIMYDGDEKVFYVRLSTELGASPAVNKHFDIKVLADKAT